ncbi:MAG: hypothetical protein ACYDAC_09210 [Candidatus Dormibacteria bacterium]
MWFLAGSDRQTSIFHVTPDPSRDRVYPLSKILALGADSAVSVGPDGTVWVGVNMTLIHLVPATAAVTLFDVPTPADSSTAESYRPASVRGAHDVTSLAVSRSGDVALAISAAEQIVILSNGAFSTWSLPPATTPVSVAYLTDGTLGASLADYSTHHVDEIVTRSPDAVAYRGHVSVPDLAATSTRFVTVNDGDVAAIDGHARVSRTMPLALSGTTDQPITVRSATALPSGNVALPSRDGVLFVDVWSGQTTDAQLPKTTCGGSTVGLPAGVTPLPSSGTCAVSPLLLAADGAGNVWMMTPDHATAIGLLSGIHF